MLLRTGRLPLREAQRCFKLQDEEALNEETSFGRFYVLGLTHLILPSLGFCMCLACRTYLYCDDLGIDFMELRRQRNMCSKSGYSKLI